MSMVSEFGEDAILQWAEHIRNSRGNIYRWSHQSDNNPFGGKWNVYRIDPDGQTKRCANWRGPWNYILEGSSIIPHIVDGSMVPLKPCEGVEYSYRNDPYGSIIRCRWTGQLWELYRTTGWGTGSESKLGWRPSGDLEDQWKSGELSPIDRAVGDLMNLSLFKQFDGPEAIARKKQLFLKIGMIVKHTGTYGRTSRVMDRGKKLDGKLYTTLMDLDTFQPYIVPTEALNVDKYVVLSSHMIEGK